MKKKIVSAVLLSTMLLSACASKDTDKKGSEPAKETTEATTTTKTKTKETTEATEATTTETSVKSDDPLALWIDANLNFGHDAGDGYIINGKNTSMAEYYAALENDPTMKSIDAYYNLYNSPLRYDEVFESALTDCDYITTTQIEFESPGIVEGAVPEEGVRIDEDNCITYYTIDVPQFTLSGADVKKANKAIIDFANSADSWYGAPNVRYQHFERDDGTKTVIFFFGDGYDDSEFKVFNFDKDNKLMSANAVIKSAGMDPATFKKKAKKSVAESLFYADDLSIYLHSQCIDCDYVSAINNPSDIFINKNGNLVVFVHSSMRDVDGEYHIPVIFDKDLELSTEILEEEFNILTVDWIIEKMRTFEFGGGEPIVSNTTIADIDTTTAGATDFFGLMNFTCWHKEGTTKDKWYYEGILGAAVTEDTTYKYEIYFNGKLIKTDSVKMKADPFFRVIKISYKYDIKPGTYCFVLYDGNDSDKILGVDWNSYE